MQDSAASAGKRPLLRPTAKLTAKEPASTGGHAKQASTATGPATSAATGTANLGTSSKAATGTVLSPQGVAKEQASPHPSAKPGPHTANVSDHVVSPISTEPASPANPDHKLYRPAGSSSSSSASASASARQAPTASSTAVRASAPLAAPPAALQVPSAAPAQADTSASSSVAGGGGGGGDADRPKAVRPKSAYISSASVPKARGPSKSAAAADDDDDDDAAERSGGHSQAERQTLPGSKTAKPHAKLDPNQAPSAVPGVAPLAVPPMPFTVPRTRGGPDAEEGDEFFAGVQTDLGSVPSRGKNVAQIGKAAQGHSHSQHRPQQASASHPPKPLARLPAHAKTDVPARTAAGIPTAVAPLPAAAPTAPSATSPVASSAASSATASAAASLATHPGAAFPGRSSSSGTTAFAPKPTAVDTLTTAELSEPVLAQSQKPPVKAPQPAAADDAEEASGAGVQSAFVPIPFGGSAMATFQTGAGTLFGSHSDADQDDLDDSFFDSISAGDMVLAQLHVLLHEGKHGEGSSGVPLLRSDA